MMRRSTALLFLALLLPALTSCGSNQSDVVATGSGVAGAEVQSESGAGNEASEPTESETATAFSRDDARPSPLEAFPVAAPIRLNDTDASESFDFIARELYSGTAVEGSELFGQGSIVVTFVQPGCDLSLGDGPTIAEAAEQVPGITYVIVHSGADDDAYEAFADEALLFEENMVHLSDHLGALSTRYGVTDFPTTLLIDADLRISAVTGAMDREAQQAAIQLVAQQAA